LHYWNAEEELHSVVNIIRRKRNDPSGML
jgi:hypothetical protein